MKFLLWLVVAVMPSPFGPMRNQKAIWRMEYLEPTKTIHVSNLFVLTVSFPIIREESAYE